MDVPRPSHAAAAFASFVRERLAEVGGTLAPLWTRREGSEVPPAGTHVDAAAGTARHLAMVIIGAAAPFAPTSHARARLLRQAYASGLLGTRESEQVVPALAISGATRSPEGSGTDLFGASG